ncbi:MAG TPA: 3-hydroxybutyryl-CoA dehydrogenase [Oligoflexia bacterium]|nr:3-hydroxybutyryl-CoA dehydrogenase [Oligoflexia bacterium]HMR24992.1 3-hydroxybutyryl-CoA dehydrogenase [Oligoflexia bacterium]
MKIGVVGAGQMGSGIAQVAAMQGFEVVLYDVSEDRIAWGKNNIENSLSRLVKKEKISSEDQNSIMARVHPNTDMQAFADCGLVVEAATENETIKFEIFKSLDSITQKSCILASNTSSIPITKIAAQTNRPDKVIGMHFMNPVPIMKLVEVIRGLLTSDETYKTVIDLAQKMGKETVAVEDFPGFLVNRILCPMINEAVFALESGIAKAEDIDTAMKLGTNQPMGPLELADFIGLDTCLYIMEVLHAGLGEDKFRPAPLLRKYVQAGLLGRKSGRGFYTYEGK